MKVLVTGATGNVGRNVVEELVCLEAEVRALTRSPERADFPEEVEVVAGDLSRPETLKAAMEGADGLHLINFSGDQYGPAPLENGDEIISLAREAGITRITVLGGGEEGSVERAVRRSDLEWTLLQPVEFMAGHDDDWGESIREEGVVREPFADRKSALVHEADIGAVAAHVLVKGGFGGQALPITGPQALTLHEKVETIARVVGRDVELIELTEEDARRKWASEGYPDELIEFLVSVYRDTPEIGYTVAPTVEQVTGRKARPFEDWVAEHVNAFRK